MDLTSTKVIQWFNELRSRFHLYLHAQNRKCACNADFQANCSITRSMHLTIAIKYTYTKNNLLFFFDIFVKNAIEQDSCILFLC